MDDLHYKIFKIGRKDGERRRFSDAASAANAVSENPSNVLIEATDKVSGFTGYLFDAPDGSYAIRGPGYKETWSATLTVDRNTTPPYSVA